VTRPLVAIVGPTASGKSQVALWIARRFDAEVVNADPQQFYQGMDIGTAKPSAAERSLAPHHLFDITDPADRVGLARYQKLAAGVLEDIWSRLGLPVLVGGSGQYVWGLIEGWTVPQIPPDEELRRRLEQEAWQEGPEALHAELAAVDPEAARKIHVNNVRRVVRALEVYRRTGQPISACQRRQPLDADVLVLGIEVDRQELDRHIAERTQHMFQQGLVEEVKKLVAAGYSTDLPSLQSMGYRQVAAYLGGDLSLEEAQTETERLTRRLARRQLAWFRPDDPRITWVADCDRRRIEQLVTDHLHRAAPAPSAG
jgi:tRNA dimethylallyltransferase